MAGLKDSGFMKFMRYTIDQGKEKVAEISDRLKQESTNGEESVMQTFTSAFKKTAVDTLPPEEKVVPGEVEVPSATEAQVAVPKEEKKPEPDSTQKTEKKAVEKSTKTKEPTKTSEEVKKEESVTKSKKAPAKRANSGTKREEKIKKYVTDVKKHYGSVDEAFVEVIVKNLGPSIYKRDAESVSCSDPKELDYLRNNFLIKKLGFEKSDKEMLDSEIQKVCEMMKGTRTKYRATFYYILAKNLKKESALS